MTSEVNFSDTIILPEDVFFDEITRKEMDENAELFNDKFINKYKSYINEHIRMYYIENKPTKKNTEFYEFYNFIENVLNIINHYEKLFNEKNTEYCDVLIKLVFYSNNFLNDHCDKYGLDQFDSLGESAKITKKRKHKKSHKKKEIIPETETTIETETEPKKYTRPITFNSKRYIKLYENFIKDLIYHIDTFGDAFLF